MFKLPRLRLIYQLIGFFVLVVMIPLLVLSVSIYAINQGAVKKQVRHFSLQSAAQATQQLEQEVNWQHRLASSFASALENYQQHVSPQLTQQWLFSQYPDVALVRIYQGNTLIGELEPTAVQATLPSILQNTPKTQKRQFGFSLQLVPQGNDHYALLVQVASAKRQGRWYQLVIPAPYLSQILHQHIAQFPHAFQVVDISSGKVIAGHAEDLNRNAPQLIQQAIKSLAPGQRLQLEENDAPAFSQSTDSPNDERHQELVRLRGTNWAIWIETPYTLQKAFIRRAQIQSLLLVAACVALIIILGLWYTRSIYRNFRQLIKGIQALAEGNYARQIRLINKPATPSEIIVLTAEFNRMAQKIAQAWEDIQQLNEALANANTKLAKLDEAKSNLIDTVSHELRTPLTSIKGYTSRLIRSYDQIEKTEQLQNLKVVKQQADRLSRLVEDLLVIPQLEQEDSLRLILDEVDLNETVNTVARIIQHKAQDRLILKLCEPTQWVIADRDRLEQVILNLIDNAIKYAIPETPIIITTQPTANHQAELSIHNDCPPITSEQRDSLFKKFTRLDEKLTRTTRGTGLGLFITKGLVQAMDGTISLNTDDGFTVSTLYPTKQSIALTQTQFEQPVGNIQTSLQSGSANNTPANISALADDEALGV